MKGRVSQSSGASLEKSASWVQNSRGWKTNKQHLLRLCQELYAYQAEQLHRFWFYTGLRVQHDVEVHPSGVPSNLARFFQLQQILGQRMATPNAANEGSGSSRHSLSPSTPLAEVIGTSHGWSVSQASGTAAIAVGVNTPPVPFKLAENI